MRFKPLGELISSSRSGFASGKRADDGAIQIRMNNVSRDGAISFDKVTRVPASEKQLRELSLERGDVLFNCTNSPELVGKTCLFRGHPERVVFSNHFVRLRTKGDTLVPDYLARWLAWTRAHGVFSAGCVRWVNQATYKKEDLLDLRIPLPPLPVQKRIAAILDAADALRAKRRELIGQLDPLIQSTFLEMFGDPVTNPRGWNDSVLLGEVADITSGLTKGRKLRGQSTREVPYLAVVNVQDRHLVLDPVKTIEATDAEITKYRLRRNDLLLTEGGDRDKLGRGTLWQDELPECIHQNHIFRVRLHDERWNPAFLNWLVGSKRGKRYFLSQAKQTTGIASINLTQLKRFPLLLPSLTLQHRFASFVESVESHKVRLLAHLAELDTLFASLQSRAFSGELCASTVSRQHASAEETQARTRP